MSESWLSNTWLSCTSEWPRDLADSTLVGLGWSLRLTISKMTLVADLCPWSTPGEEKSFRVPPGKFGKLNSGHRQDWKRSVFIPIPKKGNAKECSNYHTIAVISHASKVMLKIFQSRLQQFVNWALPNVPVEFRKGIGIRDQIAIICWIIKKSKRIPEKHLLLLHWLH